MLLCIMMMFFCSSLMMAEVYFIKEPIVSVWAESSEVVGPFSCPAWADSMDGELLLATHNTQVLYGAPVRLIGHASKDMVQVEVLLQPYFNQAIGKWQPINGYVRGSCLGSFVYRPSDCFKGSTIWVVQEARALVRFGKGRELGALPFGAIICKQEIDFDETASELPVALLNGEKGGVDLGMVRYIPLAVEADDVLRNSVCKNALKFLGMSCCWGGCSPLQENARGACLSGVDCSGLLYLLALSVGLMIPRNSGDQSLFSVPVDPACAEPGDIFFLESLASGNPNHILMYLGSNNVFEASGLSGPRPEVCISTIEERFGVPLSELKNGSVLFADHPTKAAVQFSCGSFFNDPVKLQKMRDDFLAGLGMSVLLRK